MNRLLAVVFFFFLFSQCVQSSTLTEILKTDTFEFHFTDAKTNFPKEYYKKIFDTKNPRKIAELFNKTANFYANDLQLERSIPYYDIAINIFKESGATKEACEVMNIKATVWYDLLNFEKAIDVFNKSIELRLSKNDNKGVAQTYIEMAFVYSNTFRLSQSRITFQKAIEYASKINDIQIISEVYYYIGNTFLEDKNYDSTLANYSLSFSCDEKLGIIGDIVASINNMGVIYYLKGDYENATRLYDRALHYNDSTRNDPKTLSIYYNNMGNVYYLKGQNDQAMDYYKRSLFLKKGDKFAEGQAITEYNIGNVYMRMSTLDKALAYYTLSAKKAETLGNMDVLGKNYFAMSQLYKKQGDQHKAFDYYEKFVRTKYSALLDDDGGQISELQDNNDKSRRQAVLLSHELQMQKLVGDYEKNIKEKEINILKEKKKYLHNLIFAFIGLLVFFILISLLVFWRSKSKKKESIELDKQNKDIEEKNIIIEQQAQKLLESNKELEKLSIVASETDNAVIIMDENGNFEWVNEGFTKLFGLTFDELVTKVSQNMIGSQTPHYIKDKFALCRQTLETVQYEMLSTGTAGQQIWVNVTLTPILNAEGKLSKLVSIDADITLIKKAQTEIMLQKKEIEIQRDQLKDQRDNVLEQNVELENKRQALDETLQILKTTQNKLVESEKMAALGNLVAGVSHELNTPVGVGIAAASSMVNRTEQIEESFNAKKMTMPELKAYLETTTTACELILSNLNRTADLVKSFKQVSVDNMTDQKREFNLLEYFHDIIRSLEPKLKIRPIAINIDCPESINLNSYPGAYYQILTNFINNSLMHAFEENEAGIITIKAAIENESLVIIYKDNGKGIPEENIKKVFEPFFTTHMQAGTGLGMHITYNLISQKLGGDIEIASKLGEGVVFTVTIPMEHLT